MTDTKTLIQNKIPTELQELALQFIIPEKFLDTEKDLIVLILKSKSLSSNEEKQSWFDMLNIMNTDQIGKLKNILTKEITKLKEIEKKYENKKDELKQKYTNKFNESLYMKRITTIKNNENKTREDDIEAADSLLENL